jgi:ubiquinone/menaquinone biosynthesis C-methylase UbiE
MSERLKIIVEQLKLRGADRILEIGCGHGVAATFVCDQLAGGGYVGIDRSRKMIEAAAKRNARWVQSGVAEFFVADLESLDLGSRRFDKVFAARVALFHRDPERARALVRPWLAPGGKIFSFYDEPS